MKLVKNLLNSNLSLWAVAVHNILMPLSKMFKCAKVAIAFSYKSDSFAACLPFLSCFDARIVLFNRDQDLAEPLDSEGSDTEMERGIVQVQQHSAQHRAKMWKVESVMRKTAKKNDVCYKKMLLRFLIMIILIAMTYAAGFWAHL